MKLRRLLLLTPVPLFPLTACVGEGDDRGGDPNGRSEDAVAATRVAVLDNEFKPAVITVDAGATVTWTWDGSNAHDVRGDGFASEMQTSRSFEHRFDDAGEFSYRCTLHPGMRGRVVVQ